MRSSERPREQPEPVAPEPVTPEGSPAESLAPWVVALAEFVVSHTRETVPPAVPEITLRLGFDSIKLWNQIEIDLKLRGMLPYWAFAWAGGLGLARHLLDNPALVVGRRVLDFAAGSGLVGIAAAKAGAAQVTANDIDPLATIALSINAELNGVSITAEPTDLMRPDSGFDPTQFDLVVVGDVFYEPDLAARALAFLARCRAAGCDVLIGDPGRADLPVDRLTRLSRYAVPVAREAQYYTASAADDGAHDLFAASVWSLDR
jgi:predicted nicotinamide N-methyase